MSPLYSVPLSRHGKRDSFVRQKRMKTVIHNTIVFVLLFLFVGCGTPPSDPRAKAESVHGMRLPSSAQSIQSVGDAWRGPLDRGASTVFTMDSAKLQEFVATLHVDTNVSTFIPGNEIYHHGLDKPWSPESQPMTNMSCKSPVGDFLHVRVFRLDDGRLGVHMYTDWN